MVYVQTNDSRVVRETESKALLVANVTELSRARAVRSSSKRVITNHEDLSKRLDSLERNMSTLQSSINTFMEQLTKQGTK